MDKALPVTSRCFFRGIYLAASSISSFVRNVRFCGFGDITAITLREVLNKVHVFVNWIHLRDHALKLLVHALGF